MNQQEEHPLVKWAKRNGEESVIDEYTKNAWNRIALIVDNGDLYDVEPPALNSQVGKLADWLKDFIEEPQGLSEWIGNKDRPMVDATLDYLEKLVELLTKKQN